MSQHRYLDDPRFARPASTTTRRTPAAPATRTKRIPGWIVTRRELITGGTGPNRIRRLIIR